jgi:GNAT superfamily N-acetyltransferase
VIRKLGEGDRAATARLLLEAPHYNLFMLGNLETLGFDSALCEFWGDLPATGNGDIRGLVNRYMDGWNVYGHADADWDGLGQVVDRHVAGARRLQDNPGGIASVLPYIHAYDVARANVQNLMELAAGDLATMDAPPRSRVRRATWADLDGLVEFYAGAEHMTRTPEAIRRPLEVTRIWVAEAEGAIRAAALTNAEVLGHAMIGGVYTHPAWRGRGLSAAVCSALCTELIQLGQRPLLYWHAPAAGAVYRRLGFRAIGDWRSIWLRTRG